jgi:hypothetical protein
VVDHPHTQSPVPSYREIFRFYFPLALSWLFMALEAPITTTVVSQSAGAEVQLAAMLMLFGLALWIESPVIDLLATSTTLTKDASSFAVISRFVWWLMGWCTLVHAAIALTPLFDIVTISILGVPSPVAEAARIPMAIMIPWSAFIGWRRYLQGILIRFGRTRIIGWGTAVRVLTVASISLTLLLTTDLAGIMIAAVALVCSVTAEAMFIHWASRAVVEAHLRVEGRGTRDEGADASPDHSPGSSLTDLSHKGRGDTVSDSSGLTMARLARFHLPLTATTMTFLLSLPLISGAIARSPDSISAMAGWQVATSLIFLFRTVVFALPEPIIALHSGPESAFRLARFCAMVGLAASGAMVLLSVLGGDRLVFREVFGADASVILAASLAFLACAALPLIGALQSYLRGMLTAHHFTVARLGAVLASTAVLLTCLYLGVRQAWPGVTVAAYALNFSALAELGALGVAWAMAKKKSPE